MIGIKRFIETYKSLRVTESELILIDLFVSKSKWKVGESPQHSSFQNRKIIENVLSDMEQNGLIRLTQNLIAAADFSVKLSPAMQALKEEILKQYEAGKYEMPSLDEILENKKDKVNARHIIEAMDGQELARLNHQYYISKTALLEARVKMERYIAENGQITLAEFRDMLETSRKYAVTILEYFDEQKITRKVDDARVLM